MLVAWYLDFCSLQSFAIIPNEKNQKNCKKECFSSVIGALKVVFELKKKLEFIIVILMPLFIHLSPKKANQPFKLNDTMNICSTLLKPPNFFFWDKAWLSQHFFKRNMIMIYDSWSRLLLFCLILFFNAALFNPQ